MKTSILPLLLVCFFQSGLAQISGKLATNKNEPLPFANVLLMNAKDSSLVKGIMANDAGAYTISDVKSGSYFITYSAIGFKTDHSVVFDFISFHGNKNMGTQVLEDDVQQLDEVVVKTARPLYEQETSGVVVNVESSLLTKGSSVLQVLERSPGVSIDHQNNAISLNGKSGVMVMMNGKLMRMPLAQVVALLNGMSADNIKKIELLATPPAGYDAEGSAGIINIVIKKDEELGTKGSYSLTGGYGYGEKGAGSLNIAHNTKKLNINGSYAFLHDRTHGDFFGQGTQNLAVLSNDQSSFDFWSTSKPVNNSHNVTLSIDAKVSPSLTLGSSVNYFTGGTKTHTHNIGDYYLAGDSYLAIDANILAVNNGQNAATSVYMEKEIAEGEKINVTADYLYYKNNSSTDALTAFDEGGIGPTKNDSVFSPSQRGVSNTSIKVGVGKFDYTKQLNRNTKLEAGLKGTYTRSYSLSGIESMIDDSWVSVFSKSNTIDMKEGIGAAYASVTSQLNTTAHLVVGTRYEYSHTRMVNVMTNETMVDRKLSKLFPNILFSKKTGERTELQLSYTKRISRPSYNDLASFVTYNDPVSVFTGNPALRPTITNNLKAGYNYKGYLFSLLFSRDDYPIARYQISGNAASTVVYISPQNVKYQNNISFQTNIPFRITEWWNITAGWVGGIRQFKLDHTVEKLVKTYWAYSLNGSQVFTLPQQVTFEVSGWYNSSIYNGSILTRPIGVLNAGIKKELNGNWGSLQFSVADIFKSMTYNSILGSLTQEAYNSKNHVTYHPESAHARIFKISWTKTFGNNKVKGQSQRDNGSGDESERIRR